MDNIQIVDASVGDAHGIGQISKQTWLQTYTNPALGITEEDIKNKTNQWTDEFIVGKINEQNSHTWIAKDNGKIIGFIAVLQKIK